MTHNGRQQEHVDEGAAADPAALWAAFGPPLRAFLARRVPPGVEADDLVQDVFVRVVRHTGSLRAGDRPEAWLFQIARNALNDALRARLRRDGRTDSLEVDPPAAPDAGAERAAEAELAPCLTGMIGRLAEPYRTAITLTTRHGLSQADAARQLGTSFSGMKSRVQRGRRQLREMLVHCCAIAVDVRGGVTDFHLRQAGACGEPAAMRPLDRVRSRSRRVGHAVSGVGRPWRVHGGGTRRAGVRRRGARPWHG